MKKLCVLLLASSLAFPSVAQTQKGQSITSGTINLNFSSYSSNFDATKTSSYGAGVSVNRGAFFKDNWLLGYTLGATYQRSGFDNATPSFTNSHLSAGIFLRRYWLIADRLYLYAGGGITGSRQTYDNIDSNASSVPPSNSFSELNWQLAPTGQVGALYVLSMRIAIEANATNSFPTSLNATSIGVAILMGSKDGQSDLNAEDIVAPQTQQGRWLVGASANISGNRQVSEANGSNQSLQVTAGLAGGRFVKNNLLVGLSLTYTANRQNNGSTVSNMPYSISVSPYMRSYIGTHRLRPFIEGNVGYGISKYPGSTETPKSASVGISAGLAYMAGERFIIQTTLGSLTGQYNWLVSDVYRSSNYTINATATTLSNISVAYSL